MRIKAFFKDVLTFMTLSAGSVSAAFSAIDFETPVYNTNQRMLADLDLKLQASVHQQVNSALDGAYVYLAPAKRFYKFHQEGLASFGKWLASQFYTDLNHARKLTNLLVTGSQ